MADLSYAFGLEPEQAVKYFEGLGFNVPSDWKVTWNEAQAKARAIAGIHKQDIAAQNPRCFVREPEKRYVI